MAATYARVDRLRRRVQLYEQLAASGPAGRYEKKLATARAQLARQQDSLPQTGLTLPEGVVLEVKDREELSSVINKLNNIQGVYQVVRASGK